MWWRTNFPFPIPFGSSLAPFWGKAQDWIPKQLPPGLWGEFGGFSLWSSSLPTRPTWLLSWLLKEWLRLSKTQKIFPSRRVRSYLTTKVDRIGSRLVGIEVISSLLVAVYLSCDIEFPPRRRLFTQCRSLVGVIKLTIAKVEKSTVDRIGVKSNHQRCFFNLIFW